MKFKKSHIQALIEHLPTFKLSAKASRGRQKIVNQLSEFHEELVADVNDLKEKVESKALTEEEFTREAEDILNENVTIDLTDYEHLASALQEELEEYEETLSGKLSIVHDLILSELERI